ncbi:MAG: helix-turn-helix domain-containing protein [Gammaproteobacteria bacterium]|nr:helix-turn-helix domain-containing protein [Gammaproteobacteria bacterium]
MEKIRTLIVAIAESAKSKGISQRELARRVGITPENLSRAKKGERSLHQCFKRWQKSWIWSYSSLLARPKRITLKHSRANSRGSYGLTQCDRGLCRWRVCLRLRESCYPRSRAVSIYRCRSS